MSKRSHASIKELSASVHARLLNIARNDGRPFNELLQYFAIERFLYRLSESDHSKDFVLKGAMMLRVWKANHIRPTMDIDFLARTKNEIQSITQQIREIIASKVEPDGLAFDPETVHGERITEDAEYEGVRIRFVGNLGNARIPMQLDIGFGDLIYPAPMRTELPVILPFPAAILMCYSRESSIAEKFQAMVKLGQANSRMKDFFDIWKLSRQFDFSADSISEAIRLTFKNRKTSIPTYVIAFSPAFIESKQIQWSAFHRRIQQPETPSQFATIVEQIEEFIGPVTAALVDQQVLTAKWTAPGPWNSPE